jgi:hypothetical protein
MPHKNYIVYPKRWQTAKVEVEADPKMRRKISHLRCMLPMPATSTGNRKSATSPSKRWKKRRRLSVPQASPSQKRGASRES